MAHRRGPKIIQPVKTNLGSEPGQFGSKDRVLNQRDGQPALKYFINCRVLLERQKGP